MAHQKIKMIKITRKGSENDKKIIITKRNNFIVNIDKNQNPKPSKRKAVQINDRK